MEPEVIYAIRRTDGELMQGEYLFELAPKGPQDWETAEIDAEYADDPIQYEMLRMEITVVGRQEFPAPDDRLVDEDAET